MTDLEFLRQRWWIEKDKIQARALQFAIEAHEGQKRKFIDENYSEHPRRVGITISNAGFDYRAVAVAYLHDVVEDTEYTLEDIETNFGMEIAIGVGWLTNVPKIEGQNRAERTKINIERLARAPSWVQAIKVADVVDNLPSMIEYSKPAFAELFVYEKASVLTAMLPTIDPLGKYLMCEAQNIIKEYHNDR